MKRSTTSEGAILARFKAAHVDTNPGVRDAWLDEKKGGTRIVYQLDPDKVLVGDDESTGILDIPARFEGIPTTITWWEEEQA